MSVSVAVLASKPTAGPASAGDSRTVTTFGTRSRAGEEASVSGAATAAGVPPPAGEAATYSALLAPVRRRPPTGEELTDSAAGATVDTRSSTVVDAIASSTGVITFRPPRPGLTLIMPADDQRSRRRRTLEG